MKCERCRMYAICKLSEDKRASCVLRNDYEFQARRADAERDFNSLRLRAMLQPRNAADKK